MKLMARTQQMRRLELQRLQGELRRATDPDTICELSDRMDELLDERLAEKGVHPADCSCHECSGRVAEVLAARHLGELVDPRDVAGEAGW